MAFQKGHTAIGGFKTRFKKGDNLGGHHSEETKGKIGIAVSGENNGNWNGGKKTMRGYISILKPEHPLNNAGYVLEHRLVMEEYLGRYLLPKEVVHHINETRNDNRIENLMLFENDGKHQRHHHEINRLAMAI